LIGLLLDDKELKQYLPRLSDKNQLYINLSSLNDKDFAVSAEEKKVTQDFHQTKKVVI
jgi:adenine-specific DNA-methyltransferase